MNKINEINKIYFLWPGLQWDVTVEHPAVLQLDRLRGGGPVSGARGRGVDGVAPPSQGVSVQAVGRLVGQGVVVVRRGQRRPQRGLAVVVVDPWKKNKRTETDFKCHASHEKEIQKRLLGKRGIRAKTLEMWFDL